jgi:hypothetical protein
MIAADEIDFVLAVVDAVHLGPRLRIAVEVGQEVRSVV